MAALRNTGSNAGLHTLTGDQSLFMAALRNNRNLRHFFPHQWGQWLYGHQHIYQFACVNVRRG